METNGSLMALALSLVPKYKRSTEAAKGTGHHKKHKAPRPDYRLTLVAQCAQCLELEQVVYNAIWDDCAAKFRYQLLDVLPEKSRMFHHVLKTVCCDNCCEQRR